MRRALGLWPLLAVLSAIAFALLAHGVLAAADDARAGRAPGPLARAGEALTGTRAGRELRQALALAKAADPPGVSAGLAFQSRALAEAALVRRIRHGSAAERAQAANVLAALLVRDAALDRAQAARYFAEAQAALQSAVRLDPDDEDSKFDLELLLTRQGKGRAVEAYQPAPGQSTESAGGQGEGY